jgi:hypothetical protein
MTLMPDMYQLVFQLRGSSQLDFEEMIGLERELRSAVGDLGDVDGHDMGQGDMYIFVHTASPVRLFETVRSLPVSRAHYLRRSTSASGATFRYQVAHSEFFCFRHPMRSTWGRSCFARAAMNSLSPYFFSFIPHCSNSA